MGVRDRFCSQLHTFSWKCLTLPIWQKETSKDGLISSCIIKNVHNFWRKSWHLCPKTILFSYFTNLQHGVQYIQEAQKNFHQVNLMYLIVHSLLDTYLNCWPLFNFSLSLHIPWLKRDSRKFNSKADRNTECKLSTQQTPIIDMT